jgi:hypothetical protein
MMPLEEAMVENSSYARGKLKGRLDTHCGRNLPRERTCPACGISFAPHTLRHRYCSKSCLGASNGAHLRGIPHPETRKVERPSYEQLQEELEATNFCAVARKYGVTDNAVRKWVRFYEREQERERSEGAG